MKSKILFLLLSISLFAKAQIINIPDNNLKTILTLANTTTYKFAQNAAAQFIKIDANGNGEIEQSETTAVARLTINTLLQEVLGLVLLGSNRKYSLYWSG